MDTMVLNKVEYRRHKLSFIILTGFSFSFRERQRVHVLWHDSALIQTTQCSDCAFTAKAKERREYIKSSCKDANKV